MLTEYNHPIDFELDINLLISSNGPHLLSFTKYY